MQPLTDPASCPLLLLLLLGAGRCDTCADVFIPKRPADPDHLCTAHATRRAPAGLLPYPNGSCLLLGACSPTSAWPCPVYEPMRANQSLLLLRTLASQRVSPYGLLLNASAASPDQRSDAEVGRADAWFKSPLLRSPAHPRLLPRVQLELRDANGSVVVRLDFRVEAGDGPLSSGRWFAQGRLLEAFPWSVEKMRNASYNHFSVTGEAQSHVLRRFFINSHYNSCPGDAGYLMVVEKGTCNFEKGRRHSPAYLWAADGDGPGIWNSMVQEAEELRIYGTVSGSGPPLYTGRHAC